MAETRAQKRRDILKKQAFFAVIFIAFGLLTPVWHGQSLVGLLASAASAVSGTTSTIYFTPYTDDEFRVGDIRDVDININARAPINAVGITVHFPQDMLDVVGISKQKSFLDLWTEETAIKEDIGEVHFSGGTTRQGGVEGVSTALTLSVRAKKAGDATLSFDDVQILQYDGKATPLKHTAHSYTYNIVTSDIVAPSGGDTAVAHTTKVQQPQAPSPDFDNSGRVTIVDMSILMLRLFAPYDARYDLDMDGGTGFSDLSILFSHMH